MKNSIKLLLYKIANCIYQKNYFLYKPLYFYYKKISDKEKIDFLKKEIKTGMRVLDIGANIGFYTVLFSMWLGKEGSVHAFEPDMLNFKYLKKNTEGAKNIYINNKAIGAKSEKIHLYQSKNLNVDHQTYDSGENRPFIEIDSLSIDDYFKNNEKIDLIKLDIQGYDYFALCGMKDTIKRSGKVIILGEFWPYGLYKSGVRPEDYIKLLEESGFKIEFFNKKRNYEKEINNKYFYTDFYGQKDI